MWGAAKCHRREGVLRPLTATVMIFGQPGKPIASGLCQVSFTLDHCLFGLEEIKKSLQRGMGDAMGIIVIPAPENTLPSAFTLPLF